MAAKGRRPSNRPACSLVAPGPWVLRRPQAPKRYSGFDRTAALRRYLEAELKLPVCLDAFDGSSTNQVVYERSDHAP